MIITCEHGGNEVPRQYRHLFHNQSGLLASHRGLDLGALPIAKKIAQHFHSPFFYSQTTRLLVDLNRSLSSRSLFSSLSAKLSQAEKNEILARYYLPYRREVEETIGEVVNNRRKILHLSIHSFTPVLDGQRRNADIGFLYDPSRKPEREFCGRLGEWIKKNSNFRIRYNYPYRGISDGFTSTLRTQFPENSYVGIEIEVNQEIASDWKIAWPLCKKIIAGIECIYGK